MNILGMLAELRAEAEQIDHAILALERLAAGSHGKRRGRPPKWMSEAGAEPVLGTAPSKRRKVSAAGRKRMADAQKKRWAARKAESGKAAA